jgi:hypothetical protein
MYHPLLIKFDRKSKILGAASYKIPYWVHDDVNLENADILKHVEKWLARPYLQQWFAGCRVVWIETIGEVFLLMEDFS